MILHKNDTAAYDPFGAFANFGISLNSCKVDVVRICHYDRKGGKFVLFSGGNFASKKGLNHEHFNYSNTKRITIEVDAVIFPHGTIFSRCMCGKFGVAPTREDLKVEDNTVTEFELLGIFNLNKLKDLGKTVEIYSLGVEDV